MNQDGILAKIEKIVAAAHHIVVIQADNPDADSLASALALEDMLTKLDKEVTLYCGVDVPKYLHYLAGSDRVVTELPTNFDASIIVDTSSDMLLEQLNKSGAKNWLTTRPAIVIDHHTNESSIGFAAALYSRPAASTTELIYEIAAQLDWNLSLETKELIAIGILSDTLGLSSESTGASTIYALAKLVEAGVSLAKLDNARRATMRRESELIHYKGSLLQRVEFFADERIAIVSIPWEEIEKYSPLYNPPMLVLDDMRLGLNTEVAIAFKIYPDGKVTAKIRANFGSPIADKLAEAFGGGGHPYAAGFKILGGKTYEEVKTETIRKATDLLNENANHAAL